MPDSEFVCRFRDDFEPMLKEKKRSITLDLAGPELSALRAVFIMMIYCNPDNESLVTGIEKLLFKDLGNAKKL